jgi:ABC-type antimicrobial peptide transport system permease subunit
LSPVVPAKPALYTHTNFLFPPFTGNDPTIMFKYNENTWNICRNKIEDIIKAEYPNSAFEIVSAEEEYSKYLKSENTLLQILSLISLICVIVCVFGFISIVSLTCEERRKEIAIRKIHGATIKDILDIFFKEYLTLLVVGALIAFPIGYLTMKRWLESYVIQTEISAWIYAVILLALIIAIILFVGGKVLKTSHTNPAEAVKS